MRLYGATADRPRPSRVARPWPWPCPPNAMPSAPLLSLSDLASLRVRADPGPPGKYYPFKPPIKPESPLGKLLTSKGVKFYSTRAGRSGPFSTIGGRRNMSSVPATMKVA